MKLDVQIWTPVGISTGHTGGILDLSVSKDGHIATASYDQSVRIWDMRSFQWVPERLTYNESACGLDGSVTGVIQCSIGKPDVGWFRTSNGGLLFWMPEEYREEYRDRSSRHISRFSQHRPMRIHWDRLCHGENWTSIYQSQPQAAQAVECLWGKGKEATQSFGK